MHPRSWSKASVHDITVMGRTSTRLVSLIRRRWRILIGKPVSIFPGHAYAGPDERTLPMETLMAPVVSHPNRPAAGFAIAALVLLWLAPLPGQPQTPPASTTPAPSAAPAPPAPSAPAAPPAASPPAAAAPATPGAST